MFDSQKERRTMFELKNGTAVNMVTIVALMPVERWGSDNEKGHFKVWLSGGHTLNVNYESYAAALAERQDLIEEINH